MKIGSGRRVPAHTREGGMNINEAIKARRNGASLDQVLGGLTENRRVRFSPRQQAKMILREAEEGEGGGGKGSLTGPAKDQILKVADQEGPKVAAAVMADVYDELPDDVKAAFDAIQGNSAPAAAPMDFDFGGGDTGGDEKAEEEPKEGATSGPDELEGAELGGGGGGDLAGGAETVESLKRRLRSAQVIGESLLRRARRLKAERDHFQSKLGLTEAESNLDVYCESGYAYDVHQQACVRVNKRVEAIVNEMMDPIDSPNSTGGKEDKEYGVGYGFPVDDDPGADDPLSGSRAATGGQSSSKFTKGGSDPLGFGGGGSVGGGGSGMGETASPHTHQSFNQAVATDRGNQGDSGGVPGNATGQASSGQCPTGYVWDDTQGLCVPATNHPTPGTPTGESMREAQRQREILRQNQSPMFERTDSLGRPILDENVHQARRANRNVQRQRRFAVSERERQARVSMIAEVFARYGVQAAKSTQLAEMYMDGDPEQRATVMRHAALDVPGDYAGAMATDVSQAAGCGPAAGAMPAPMMAPPMMGPGAGGMVASTPNYAGDVPGAEDDDEDMGY